MQPPTVREVIERLEREGWEQVRRKGGRKVYRKNGKIVTIHGKLGSRIANGTYGAIKRQAGW